MKISYFNCGKYTRKKSFTLFWSCLVFHSFPTHSDITESDEDIAINHIKNWRRYIYKDYISYIVNYLHFASILAKSNFECVYFENLNKSKIINYNLQNKVFQYSFIGINSYIKYIKKLKIRISCK